MKKLLICIGLAVWLGACSAFQGGKPCASEEAVPSFFAHGEQLAAFEFLAQAKGHSLAGILQIKKLDEQHYDMRAFSIVGGYRLFEAEITPQEITYHFITKEADSAALRAKLKRLAALLLFAAQEPAHCQRTEEGKIQIYQKPHPVQYRYRFAQQLPVSAWYKKGWGYAKLDFVAYNEQGAPLQLAYEDGAVQLQLRLIRLR